MALKLKIAACTSSGCSNLIFRETTGIESASNSTGWMGSAPYNTNEDVADYDYARIDVLLPDGITTKTFEFSPGDFPTSDTALEYEITAADLYGTSATVVTDGLYKITYTVRIDSDPDSEGFTTDCYFLFSCNIKCCVDKIVKKIAYSTDCSCDSTVIKNALYAHIMYESLLANKDCGNPTVINDLLTELNKICGFSVEDCGCK